jgi:fructose-bisphosphate aldolase class I
MEELRNTAQELVNPKKGILAADESTGTIKKRFETIGLESTPELNGRYREILVTTRGIEDFISGIIFFDETVRQQLADGTTFPEYTRNRGIIPGIKVDEGKDSAPSSPQEKITKGLENLPVRLREYKEMGLRFTKWRAAILIGDRLPTKAVVDENAKRLARFAKISQQEGFVPIVEPEVLRDGSHDIEKCEEVTRFVLSRVFSALEEEGVYLEGLLLKTNMVTAGKENEKADPKKVAEATLRVLTKTVFPKVAGIVFLSGGQTPKEATSNLNAINSVKADYPWELSFSFGRALQDTALKAWKGKDVNVKMAQEAFYLRAKMSSLARQGKWDEEMELE